MNESTLRRRAAKAGYRLWKVRTDSRYFWEYGPWSIIDADINGIVASGLDLDEVGKWLTVN